jgi:ABC-type sugar transport system ATPase subunit
MRGIVKRFGGLVALNGVDFTVAPGEVMALVGDNGAGKSTLIKTMSGAYLADAGEILLRGQPMRFHSPKDAWACGIATIYQELALAGKMTVPDNIFLGREIIRPRFGLPFPRPTRHAAAHGRALNQIDVHLPAWRAGWRTSPAASVRAWRSPAR